MQIAADPAECEGRRNPFVPRRSVGRRAIGGCGSVRNAQCPGLRGAVRGIYAGNRVCVRGWRDYVMTFPAWGTEVRATELLVDPLRR